MKTYFRFRDLFYVLICSGILATSCSDDSLPMTDNKEIADSTESPDAWHDKIREKPYPKADNEIFINPAPFIVPQDMMTGEQLQFSLSQKEDFPDAETIVSEPKPWCMFNPHQIMNSGTWYWRFRSIVSGTPQSWSATYSFEIKDDTPKFVTPTFDTFFLNIPHTHPRLYCFLDNYLEQARKNASKHREYKALTGRANIAAGIDYTTAYPNPFDFESTEDIKLHVDMLYQAYHLTQNTKYLDKMKEILRYMRQKLPSLTDKELFATNFGSTNIAIIFIKIYDIAFNELSAEEKRDTEELLMKIARHYYKMYRGMQENRFFDNHFWQHNMRILFQSALVLFDKDTYTEECSEMLEYYYELWTARAPDAGYNRSGLWKNGVGYFTANVKTLFYMPSLFSTLTGSNFLTHPWYRNAGQALVYAWPPQSKSTSFGDGNEKASTPDRQRVAFADFLARETGDAYASWYAKQCDETLVTDVDMRLYRMISPKIYSGKELPSYSPKLLWYKDAGEVAIHSDLQHIDNNLSLAFRSSTFGSNSHAVADQNSFTLLYRGHDVFRNGGYYIGANNTPYNLLWYRHTRGHNSILVNGIGQPYSLTGYGQVLRAIGGNHIAYCLGDASKAYNGISEEKSWTDLFASAGIAQTLENGFGKTPLKKYKRHILVLYPQTMLIYDELEANEPVQWEWLLHSPTPFSIDNTRKSWKTANTEKGFYTKVSQFSDISSDISQTDQTIIPITETPDPQYPTLWHLTGTFAQSERNRILTIIQIASNTEQVPAITRQGDTFYCGDWDITAILNPQEPAELIVTNRNTPTVFSYSPGNPTIEGSTYLRRYASSSLLYDETNGKYGVTEQIDYIPASTRMAQ